MKKGQILYDSTHMKYLRVIKFIGTENGGCQGLEKVENRSYSLINAKFQFCKMKNILEMEGGDDGIAMWMYLMTLSYTLKMVKIWKFMPYVFYHN